MIQIIRVMWPQLRPYRWRLFFVILAGIAISGLKSATPELLRQLPVAWESGDPKSVYQIPLMIAGAWIIAAGLRYFHLFWMLYISELIAVDLRRRLMDKYLSLNLGFFQSYESGTGGLISRMLNDISVIQSGFQRVADVVREPAMVIFSFSYLLYLDWRLTLFVMAGAPLITWILRKFAKSVRKHSTSNQKSMEDLTQVLKESLDGTRVVQSFNLQEEMRHRFDAQAQDYLRSKAKIISREEASGPISESVASVFVALLLIYIGHLALQSKFGLGDFMSFIFAVGLLSDSVKKVQGAYIKLQQSSVALDRLHALLAETQVVPEVRNPKPFPKDWQEIEFRHVSFKFADHEVLRNVSFKIKRGEQVALVGSSGAGKSTLINLLPRFFDPSYGQILIGGVPLTEMQLTDLRAHIALVTQDVFLFSESVERNIWSGNFNRDKSEIIQAAKSANAHDFIVRNDDGYQVRMGDRGSRFSGGEKQRISIARALFKDAPILILDEATSALDSESELEVQKGLDSLTKGRTALVIAHRLSTIAKADRILVMDKGLVIEEGSHDELMERKGAYHRFFQLQSRL